MLRSIVPSGWCRPRLAGWIHAKRCPFKSLWPPMPWQLPWCKVRQGALGRVKLVNNNAFTIDCSGWLATLTRSPLSRGSSYTMPHNPYTATE